MYNRLLLPLDSSPLAEQNLLNTIAIAECFQFELILLQVPIPLLRPPTTTEAAILRAEEAKAILVHEYLESAAVKVQEKGITAQVVTFEGHPHFQILQYAETNHVDMMAMCSGGQSGYRPFTKEMI